MCVCVGGGGGREREKRDRERGRGGVLKERIWKVKVKQMCKGDTGVVWGTTGGEV